MEKEALYALLHTHANLADVETIGLEAVLKEYPYFQTARLLYVKKLGLENAPNFNEELGRTSIFCGDRKRLFYYMKGERYAKFFNQYDAEEQEDRTQALLDTFLESLPEEIIQPQESNIVSNDYFAYLESIGTTLQNQHDVDNSLKHQDIIDTFIEKSDTHSFSFQFEPTKEKQADFLSQINDNESDDSPFLTETLARIYIKQKKYAQALTIIKRLSLNFPKKSVYFADQIRFLELLILNEKNKQ